MKYPCSLQVSPATIGLNVRRLPFGLRLKMPSVRAKSFEPAPDCLPAVCIQRMPGLRQVGLVILTMLCIGMAVRPAAADDRHGHYLQTNLVSDISGLAAVTDPHLVNPWGLSLTATSPWWVSDNGTGLSTLYNGAGAIQALVVTVPNVPGVTEPSEPTGTVANSVATDFLVAAGKPAHFLFDTDEGTISAWNSGTSAVLMVDNSSTADYKGLTIAQSGGVSFLYAANFEGGTVDVFDSNFKPVNLGRAAFRDPLLPRAYAPFNVQSVGGSIYVAFAEREADLVDEVHGPGRGLVDVFSPAGVLQKRLQWGLWFNAPWGVALAPADFGRFSNMILVGQFGSGRIAAFDPANGEFRGLLRGTRDRPLIIDGLWSLTFGNGASAGPVTTLYFTAGIDNETHGLFGTITPVAGTGTNDNDHDDSP
jgi:uncharacterized protein (TIGR03118 family)